MVNKHFRVMNVVRLWRFFCESDMKMMIKLYNNEINRCTSNKQKIKQLKFEKQKFVVALLSDSDANRCSEQT
jgi:sulfur relay (sulfurtransferase) DsrC/TusE family protein